MQSYRPLFVITISVPSLWNFSQSSLPSNVTLGSSTTPSSSGWWGGTRWCDVAKGWCGAIGNGDECIIPGGNGSLNGRIPGPPGPPWWWWWSAAAAAARTAAFASSGVWGPSPNPWKQTGNEKFPPVKYVAKHFYSLFDKQELLDY